jgi:hypothetical protein
MLNGLIAGGYLNAYAAALIHVRTQVEAEYAERLQGAPKSEKRRVKREISREVKRRVRIVAPRFGLY